MNKTILTLDRRRRLPMCGWGGGVSEQPDTRKPALGGLLELIHRLL